MMFDENDMRNVFIFLGLLCGGIGLLIGAGIVWAVKN